MLCFVAVEEDETLLPILPADTFDVTKHIGTKGIQGHQRSCFLDATLYGMFTFSNAFDILFLEEVTSDTEGLNLQRILKSEIVHPLRKYVRNIIILCTCIRNWLIHTATTHNLMILVCYTHAVKSPTCTFAICK